MFDFDVDGLHGHDHGHDGGTAWDGDLIWDKQKLINPFCGVICEFYYVVVVCAWGERQVERELQNNGFFISNWWEGFGIFLSLL